MMKLIIAIVQEEDGPHLVRELNDAGYAVTRLATKGGFLRSGNITLLLGTEEEKVPAALKIIEENSKSRTQYVAMPASGSAMHGLVLAPIEVKIGGATVFVLDVDQFHKF